MADTQTEALNAPFPRELLKQIDKGGRKLDYIPGAEVIARLNKVLGTGCWDTEVLEVRTFGNVESPSGPYPKYVVAHVKLSAVIHDPEPRTTTKAAWGGQTVKFGKNNGDPVDLGDEFKGACTDALKKAAQQLGVGLELARTEEALMREEEQQAAAAAKAADAAAPKADKATLDAIMAFLLTKDPKSEERVGFTRFWNELTGHGTGRGKKFDDGEVTVEEAAKAIEHLGIKLPSKRGRGKAAEESAEPEPENEGDGNDGS